MRAQAVAEFWNEMRTMTVACQHPNVVRMLGACHEGNDIFIVMEAADGRCGRAADVWARANAVFVRVQRSGSVGHAAAVD